MRKTETLIAAINLKYEVRQTLTNKDSIFQTKTQKKPQKNHRNK